MIRFQTEWTFNKFLIMNHLKRNPMNRTTKEENIAKHVKWKGQKKYYTKR